MEPRWDKIINSSNRRRRRRVSPRVRLTFIGLMFIVILALIAAAVFAYIQIRVGRDRADIPELSVQVPKEVMNVLILGSDSREGLSAADLQKFDPEGVDRKTGRRADTIMLLHVDAKQDEAVLVHFPRDLRVKLPGGNLGKINGAYQKGPGSMIQTIETFTGLPINHYVEVNFAGFNKIVDTLGGVKVFFEKPINDPDSGLSVPKGCVSIEGDQALAFVRVRKIDDDFGRIARQQLFVKLMMDKLTKKRTLLNPVKVVKLVNLFAKNVQTDADLSLSDMKTLALRLRGFNSGEVDLRVVPSAIAPRIGGVSFVIANQKQTDALFAAIKERKPLPDYGRTGVSPIDPGDIELTVLNGTKVDGLAREEVEKLKTKGYVVSATGTSSSHALTTVYYKEGNEEKANIVAALYGAPIKIMPASMVVNTQLALVLGANVTAPKPSVSPAPAASRSSVEKKPLIHPCP